MKNIIVCLSAIIVLGITVFDLCAQAANEAQNPDTLNRLISTNVALTNDAIEYYEYMVGPLRGFNQASYDYMKVVTRTRRARAVERSRQDLLKNLQSLKGFVGTCKPFQKDSTLKAELIDYLDLVHIVFKEDFDKILDMEDIREQSYDQAEAYQLALDLAIEKRKESYELFKKAEDNFFKKYQITVNKEKSELALKIEKANRAIKYFNYINRIFFKVNKQDFYARKAVVTKDVAGLEQHAMTLISFAEEGLEKLKQDTGYDGDSELVSVTIKLLEYYKSEGENNYPANVEFILKADNFQNASKKFNSIKKNDRKQEDIKQYNKAVLAYNKAIKEINKRNKASDRKHKALHKSWEKAKDNFFKNHS